MVKPVKPARPDPPSAARIFFRRYLERYRTDAWIWGTIALLLAVILGLLAARILLTGERISNLAFDRGQRAFVMVSNGYVDGNVRHTRGGLAPSVSPSTEPPSPPPESSKPDVKLPESSSATRLPPAPLASLVEQTERGLLPIIGKDGTLPWRYYARPHPVAAAKPVVALVLTGLGLSKPRTEEALTLAPDFTLSFSPYAGDARKWAEAAREKGFETLVDLPMESVEFATNGIDPGPHGLMRDAGDAENSNRLAWVMSRFSGYVGLLGPEEESITGDAAVIRPALTELAGHGVAFIYLKSSRNAALGPLIASHRFSALGIDTVLDDEPTSSAISRQLDALTAQAKAQGSAVGLAHAYPPTLAALGPWVETLRAQGIELVPVSAILKKAAP